MGLRRSRKFKIAQTTTELAVFGTILIFILGIILKQATGFSYTQNMGLKATRMAMRMSYEHSSGLFPGGSGDGDASRNNASVLIIEDRLTSSSAKYGGIDRSPQIASGSATHSRNLLMPIEAGEEYQMPVMDIYINGKYFAMTSATLRTVSFNASHPDFVPLPGCACVPNVYEKVFNVAGQGYNAGASDIPAFDLNRNGTLDPEEPQAAERANFSWQWKAVSPNDLSDGRFIDVDADLKAERISSVPDTPIILSVEVQDYQAGDLDFTQNTYDIDVLGETKFGLTKDVQIYTFTETPNDPLSEGTFLRIQEGHLVGGSSSQIVRSIQRKDQIDLISRKFIMANDNGVFCTGGIPRDFSAAPASVTRGMPVNPVEACGDCLGTNYDVTCMENDGDGNLSMWVRSRILDRRGRKWITNIMGDDSIDFIR